MDKENSRRNFLRGVAAAALVVGFDTRLRGWVTARELVAGVPRSLAADFPAFDGSLLTDDASLDAAADDFGHFVHRRPVAVLQPGSVNDVVRMVQFARANQIQVAARGQGHSTQGQDQALAGVVIEMSALAQVQEINSTSALVGGGTRWLDLLAETVPQGLTPPVLVDFLELTVGGTLSVGGIGSQAFRYGPQVDNVLELQVVTGEGELVTCSPTQQPRLFDAVRAGLGQFAVIVSARVRLVAAPPSARLYHALYGAVAPFLADLQRLIDDGRFDTVQGFASPDGAGGWVFLLEVSKYFSAGHEPDDAALLSGLSFIPGTQSSQDMSYFDYLNRLAPTVAFLRQIGAWFVPHPWVNLFVPSSTAADFIGGTLAALNPDDVGQGPVLIYPFNRPLFRAPFLRVPDESHFFVFSLLRNALPPTPERTAQLVAANRQLFDAATAAGGKRYPIDSVPMTRHDWQQHFQPAWGEFVSAKHIYDPGDVLTPGQGIF